MLKLAVTE